MMLKWKRAYLPRVPDGPARLATAALKFRTGSSRRSSAPRVGQHAQQRAGLLTRLALAVDRFGNLLQPRTVGRAAHHECHIVLDPEDRADRADRTVAQRSLRRLVAAAIDGEALA